MPQNLWTCGHPVQSERGSGSLPPPPSSLACILLKHLGGGEKEVEIAAGYLVSWPLQSLPHPTSDMSPLHLSEVIILHTLLGLLIFYTVYYMTGSICYGAFRINSFGMLIPFGFKTEPSFSNSSYLANVLAMEITFFISGLLFALLLRWWIWDYAITVTLAHVLLTCAVMKEFPLVWQWWLAL
ncbi:hypothetical protein EYD10_11154, partial [Varanus komodoensis]